ncbi:hypothetical protein D3C74_109980 [compost metagenome]
MAEAKEIKTQKTKPEVTYTKREIMDAAAGFKVSLDVLAGALRRVEKDTLTRAEVEKAIQDFKKREV